MSATNWAQCPRCLDRERERLRNLTLTAEAAYGVAERETYERLVAEARDAANEFDDESCETFREDYEFYGAETGTLHVRYVGGCAACGLETSYDGDAPFYPPPS